jgi:hypothetical protein
VHIVMNLQFPLKKNFLTSWWTISFWRMTLLHALVDNTVFVLNFWQHFWYE